MRHKDPKLMSKIKSYIDEYAMENNGVAPSTRQIGLGCGISHVCAYKYLKEMAENEMIQYENGEIRTDVIDKISDIPEASPMAGGIPCGTPEEQQEMIEEYISIAPVFTNYKRGPFFVLKASGESMVDAGIDDGDLVIIRQQAEARPGDIVAALVDGRESTLKRIKQDSRRRKYLWAENENWASDKRIIKGPFEVQGVAISVVKYLG